jgi:hypothetical protein
LRIPNTLLAKATWPMVWIVHSPLYNLCLELTKQNSLPSSHWGVSAVMNQVFTVNTQCWSDITCFLAIRVHWPRKWMLDEIALSKLCFLGFIFLWISASGNIFIKEIQQIWKNPVTYWVSSRRSSC